MTTHRYLSADQWGLRWARPPQREVLRDPECYFHHVGGSAWMDGDAAAIFRNLNEYAINVKGYSALDYDLLVHYDRTRDILTIGEGRGEWMSAATRNRNEEGEAIVVCGNLDLRDILPPEIEGVARAHVIGVERGWIARDAQILGHRDNPEHPDATSCPGRYGYVALPAIRTRAAELLAPPPEPEPAPPTPPSTEERIVSPNDGLYIVAKLDSNGSFWLSDGKHRWHSDGKKRSQLRVAAGLVDLKTGNIVHDWNQVGVVSQWWIDTYMGLWDGQRKIYG